jgi:hypothetical protein
VLTCLEWEAPRPDQLAKGAPQGEQEDDKEEEDMVALDEDKEEDWQKKLRNTIIALPRLTPAQSKIYMQHIRKAF